MALTLSDELRIHYDLGASSNRFTYKLYLITDEETKHIYTGNVYYIKPDYIYFKDIITPYVYDYNWLNIRKGDVRHISEAVYKFKVKIVFDNGSEFISDDITAETTIPTVSIPKIPSILPAIDHYSTEFIFGWFAKLDSISTNVYASKSPDTFNESNIISSVTTYRASHVAYGSNMDIQYDAGVRSVWMKEIADDYINTRKIAEFDQHNSRFYLIWTTRDNDYMCRPFCKRSDLTESVSTSYIETLSDINTPYKKNTTFKWKLNSDWLSYDEFAVYESLLISPVVYLYDSQLDRRYQVNITDNTWTEKNDNNTKKPFNMTVTAELAHSTNITY